MSQMRVSRGKASRVWLFVGLAGVLVLAMCGFTIVRSLSVSSAEGSPPVAVVTPSATPTSTPKVTPTATPSATPTATPTPTPTPTLTLETWQFSQTHLSFPSVGLDVDVAEYTPEEREANGGVIDPPTKESIVWDSWMYKRQGIPSIPSGVAGDCVFIYGHAYKDGSAPFNKLVVTTPDGPASAIPDNGEVIMTTANGERVVYTKQSFFTVGKAEQGSDPRMNNVEWIPGCLKVVTCLSDGERDASGHAVSIAVTVFQQKQE